MITIKRYLRTSRTNRSGESAVYFIANAGGRPVWVGSGVFVSVTDWDPVHLLPKPLKHLAGRSAELLRQTANAQVYLQLLQLRNLPFTENDFKGAIAGADPEGFSNPLLKDLFTEYTSTIDLCWKRIQHYNTVITQIESVKPGTRLKDVDHIFALKLEKYFLKLGNSRNTVNGKIRKLKAVIHYAQLKKLLKEDPLQAIKLADKGTRRTALSRDELQHLATLLQGNELTEIHKPVLQVFLFCCYTGLRYGDVSKLTHGHLKNNAIQMVMNKTDEPVSVPLLPEAKALIQHPSGACFSVYTNQATNRYLKHIAAIAGFNKSLTFHVSRHTFATICISLNIPIKIVSKMLGHKKVATTEKYVHVLEEMMQLEMLKWSALRVAV